MELRHLEHFVAAAEEGHFTRAAQRVNIVQSGLSLSIRSLEAELGVRLFTRTARGVVLTPSGRALLPEAQRVIAAANRARHSVTDVGGHLSGTVSSGVSIALPPNLDAPRLIGDFRAAHRAVHVRLMHETSTKTFDLVRSGTLDFAIAATAGTPPTDLTTIDLGASPMLFVCATNHRLANRRSVTLTSVAQETFIDFQVDWTVRRLVDIGFDAAGLARDTAYVVNETTYLLRFVEKGLAVAILPLVYAQLHPAVRFIRVRPALPPWRAVGAHLGEQPSSAAARALMKVLCDQVRIARRTPDRAE